MTSIDSEQVQLPRELRNICVSMCGYHLFHQGTSPVYRFTSFSRRILCSCCRLCKHGFEMLQINRLGCIFIILVAVTVLPSKLGCFFLSIDLHHIACYSCAVQTSSYAILAFLPPAQESSLLSALHLRSACVEFAGLAQEASPAAESSPSVSQVVQDLLSSPISASSGPPVPASLNATTPEAVAPAPAVAVVRLQ